ncbi:hypothetical protein N0V95_001223 [Ascochyta clinopodiicola]|nr:hypothetical protein N0V95_001223 [Ascochyta clinopodiicola]
MSALFIFHQTQQGVMRLSKMVRQRGLLDLPAELHVQIAAYLVSSVKHADSAQNLFTLALICRQLVPVVREALCLSPVLQSSKVHLLLSFLFKYPNLAKTVKTLTVETKGTQEEKTSPISIPRLEPDVLNHCKRHLQTLPIPKRTQDSIITSLKAPQFKYHGLLLSLLLTLLPGLKTLYLGGSTLLNLPIFHHMISSAPEAPKTPDCAKGPDLSWVVELIGPQLTALELPIDFRRSLDDSPWQPPGISQIPDFFPNLRWLSVPYMAATRKACSDIIPHILETLVLTDARCTSFEPFANGLVDHTTSTAAFPYLSQISLYHRYATAPTDEPLTKTLVDAGIEVQEYIPDYCLRSGAEFYHPWMYTTAELDALADKRHAGYTKMSGIGPQ